MSLSATFAGPITTLSVARSEDQFLKQKKNVCFIPAGLQPLHLHFQPFRNRESARPVFRVKHTSICAASLGRISHTAECHLCCTADTNSYEAIIYHYCCTYSM